MDIRSILQNNYSKTNQDFIIQSVIDYNEKIEELMICFFDSNLRICQRSANVVSKISKKNSELFLPFIPRMLQALNDPIHSAITRNIVRVWQTIDIPEEYLGEIFDKCMSYINDPKKAIAVRAFSIEICSNICKKYPELKGELIEILNLHYEAGSSGIKHKIKKSINALN
jgi:hypothetical protein